MKRAIVPGLGVVALLAVLGAVRPAVGAGPASEPIAERLTDMGPAVSLGFGVIEAEESLGFAFADFNALFVPLIGADERLTNGLHVFQCPMFENARWLQRIS